MVSTEGVLFIWRIPFFVEKCVSFSRRESCSSGVGGHTLLGEGCVLTLRRGSYFAWGGGGVVRFGLATERNNVGVAHFTHV